MFPPLEPARTIVWRPAACWAGLPCASAAYNAAVRPANITSITVYSAHPWRRRPTREVKLASIGSLFVPLLVMVFVGIAVASAVGRQSMTAHGPQGFAEAAYAYLSQAQNNGSAFAGYSGFVQPAPGNLGSHGLVFADLAGGLVMTLGRFVPILAALALAGSLGPRRIAPAGLGTLRTDTPTFVVFLIGFVVIFAVLTFLTVLFIAPLAQALSSQMLA